MKTLRRNRSATSLDTMTRRLSTSWMIVAIFAVSAIVAGCRPSQQARKTEARDARNGAPTNTGGAAGAQTMMDSLLRVQNHLVDLIDTMSGTLQHDRERIRNLESEVARLRSMLEQQKLPANTSGQTPLPPIIGNRSYTSPPTSAIPPGGQLPSMTSGSAYTDRYSHALQLFNEARYEDAYTAFDGLVQADPQSTYTPNYVYWRGESSYALGRYAEAQASFKVVIDKYPSCSKADDASFKLGECYEKLGNRSAARTAYQHVLAVYPDSEYRSRVESRLRKLQ